MYEMHESRCTLEESAIPHCPCKMLRYGRTPHLGSTLWPALPQALFLALSPLLECCRLLNPTAATLVGLRDPNIPSTTGLTSLIMFITCPDITLAAPITPPHALLLNSIRTPVWD